ncbi:sigma-70 family RNA polymerase sigma factor [Xanthomonas sp. AmX2]|uniref:RNA polymerase sigma factor n=1 Tax=Xanthomonas sp. TaxID=29446 RepID=UPI00197E1DC1|nr:sigma-70 family RNA polymerase sigma factor [Xanthomonas sp.]MBN6152174.1 sigma-70 family RNA polymerase sigma factor [Xanthomonas sp.]
MPSPPPAADQTLDADRALAAAVLAGRPGAFEQLVRGYQNLCWHIVDRMVRHPDDTRDLCQEVFLRVYRSIHQYRGESALKSWIAQVAYSVARRHLERKRVPIAEPSGDEDGMFLAERVGDGTDLEATAASEEINALLHGAIDALPPLQRTVLTLYHLEEMQIGEIAHMTGLAEGTIKSHLFRSRLRLRELLQSRIGASA